MNDHKSPWANRIVGEGMVSPGELIANPLNWRKHPKHQKAAVNDLLKTVGWVDRVIVNRRTGLLIDGHLRVELAAKQKDALVPVSYIDVDEKEERLLIAVLDAITGLATADAAALGELLAQVETDSGALQKLLNDLAEDADLVREFASDKDAAPQVDQADVLREQWGVERDQLWLIDSAHGGTHRLMCGDSTSAADVARLFGETRADCLFTSPPYNVGVNYASHDDAQKPVGEYLGWLGGLCRVWIDQMAQGRAFVWNIGASAQTAPHRHAVMLEDAGLLFQRQFIWRKVGVPIPTWHETALQRRARTLTSNQVHEMVYIFSTGKLERGALTEFDETLENDVFTVSQSLATVDIPEGTQRTGANSNLTARSHKAHPAAFPPKLAAAFIQHYTAPGESVAEPFAGSGSTLIACEQLKRVGFGMELEPKYVAIALQRLADVGLSPRLAE